MGYMAFVTVFSIVAAVVCTILLFVLVLPAKKYAGLNKFFKVVADIFNMRQLLIERILKALYVFLTLECIISGFFTLFYVESSQSIWGPSSTKWHGLEGLVLMIFGPIVIRVIFEFMMLIIKLVENTNEINKKIPAQSAVNTQPVENYTAPAVQETYVPNYRYCTKCGTKYDANLGGCPNGCSDN